MYKASLYISKFTWDNVLRLDVLWEWAGWQFEFGRCSALCMHTWKQSSAKGQKHLAEALLMSVTSNINHFQKCLCCMQVIIWNCPTCSGNSRPKEKSTQQGTRLYETQMSSGLSAHRANNRNWETALQMFYTLTLSLVCKGGNPPTERFLPMPAFKAGAHCFQNLPATAQGTWQSAFQKFIFPLFPVVISHWNNGFWQGILAQAAMKGDLQSNASFSNHLKPHCKCHISRGV